MLRVVRITVNALLNPLGFKFSRIDTPAPEFFHAFRAQRRLLENKESPLILDVGANIGQTVAHYRETFARPILHCFEPDQTAFEQLRQRYSGLEAVVLHQAAMGRRSGTASFHAHKVSGISSLLEVDQEHIVRFTLQNEWAPGRGEVTESVQVLTIDGYLHAQGITHVDILKVDAQGTELQVLEGAERALGQNQISIIYCELNFGRFYHGQGFHYQIAAFLHRHGYELYDFYDLRRGHGGVLGWGDALFVNRNLFAALPEV